MILNISPHFKMKFLGNDVSVLRNQVIALVQNVLSWLKSYIPDRLKIKSQFQAKQGENCCVVVQGPGGLDQLQMISLHQQEYPYNDLATIGYNVLPGVSGPYVKISRPYTFQPDLVLVRISHFSINYADVCIRWGLYESALRYVGFPICPGFDFSATVIWAGEDTDFNVGDNVFGFTMFGAYSSCLLVPARQIRRLPKLLNMEKAAALPAVAATALHSIALAGGWPSPPISKNKAALVHSAGGGVGSMLIQMLKICGYCPIVGVVGASHKIQYVLSLGADHCIVKEKNNKYWDEIEHISPDGYAAIFDANGIETLNTSYNHLSLCGKLVIYGFHSNIPKASSLLSPSAWLVMILKVFQMPKFDPMNLVLDSKSVSGFNLSFFAEEYELVNAYLTQIIEWINSGGIKVTDPTVFEMVNTANAHELIQTGQTVGKLVVKVPN